MSIREIESKSILRKQRRIDSWFLSRYYANLYQGCHHNCSYCDGRSESYHVNGEFGKDVTAKMNSPYLLRDELDRLVNSRSFRPGYFMLGGGVCDSFQPVEKQYELARRVLEFLPEYPLPLFLLTKSTLVLRDLDFLERIHKRNPVVVAFSFSTVDAEIAKIVEPGVPPPADRLAALQKLKAAGFGTGMCLMPVLPGLSDDESSIRKALKAAKKAGVDFVLFSGLTLKRGRQEDHYLKTLETHFPELIKGYRRKYKGDRWGRVLPAYAKRLNLRFGRIASEIRVRVRIPTPFFDEILHDRDRVIVMLEHMDYMAGILGEETTYRIAANILTKSKALLQTDLGLEGSIPGMKKEWVNTINELIATKSCDAFRTLESKFFD